MLAEKSECRHLNFEVLGTNLIGEGTCKDCKEAVRLSYLFNNLAKEMYDTLMEMKSAIRSGR